MLIQVTACGVSQVDKRCISGDLSDIKPSSGRLGFEVSGTISKIGNSVKDLVVGDEVVASIPIDVGGGFGEFVAVPSNSIGTFMELSSVFIPIKVDLTDDFNVLCFSPLHGLAKRPNTVTDIEGAALVNDGILAFTTLHYKCHFSAGDSILIFNACSVRSLF